MSTSAVTTWATDISQFGPIYPLAGSEVLWYIVGLAFWIGFHLLQWCIESREHKKESESLAADGRMQGVLEARDHQDRF